jgi:hypothetical protein
LISDKPEKPKSNTRRFAGIAISLILTGLFLYFAFRNVDLKKALDEISRISIPGLLGFWIIFNLSHYARALRWKVLIESVKPNTKVLNLFGSTMIGYGVNCVVPRLGELMRPMFLGKWENLSRTSMIGTIIVERVIDIVILGLSVLIAVIIYPGDLYEKVVWLKSTVYLGFGAIFAVIVVLLLIVQLQEKFSNAILKVVEKISHKLADKLKYIFDMLIEGFSTLKGSRHFLLTFLLSVVIQILYGLSSYAGFFMVNMQNHQEVTFAMAWIVMTISAFGIVFPTPGGTGSYHLINIFVLVNIFNFNYEVSAAYALLTHLIAYFTFIFFTVFFYYFINKRQEKRGMERVNFLNVFKGERTKKI